MTIDNDYDKGWLSSDDSPGCAFGSSDEFAGKKDIIDSFAGGSLIYFQFPCAYVSCGVAHNK
ncbi:MAG: hypothetical protein FVQ77_09780 [Cytophagales bacterium]|nr:hypothetical protein [Cytophagales bacterium]